MPANLNWSAIGIVIAILLPSIGVAVTWGAFTTRLNSVENWQEKRETFDTDIATMKYQLLNIDKQLDAMTGSIGRIIEQGGRGGAAPSEP